jgi:phosphohistidine phosphatase SixA
VTGERQLDAAGRAAANRMGAALRRLEIPVGEVVTSPAYRARETARHAGLGNARTEDALGDGGQSMKRADEKQATWLSRKVGESPPTANTILITHQPNIARAFPDAADVAEGEALVFRPDGKGRGGLVARVPIDRWPDLK